MITRYIASATIQFNPFARAGRTARIFASLLPPDARAAGVKVVTTVLPAATTGEACGRIEVSFKDGKQVKLNTGRMSVKDLVEEMDRHSRMLSRGEELGGA